MPAWSTNPLAKKVPVPYYNSLKALDRYRSLCLWLPVTLANIRTPWGYTIDPNNPKMAIPNEKAIPFFIQANEYLKEHSYETVAQWLTSCNFPITDDGLLKMFKDRPVWSEISLPYEERLKL